MSNELPVHDPHPEPTDGKQNAPQPGPVPEPADLEPASASPPGAPGSAATPPDDPSRLRRYGDASLRASALQRMMALHGNRFVQRQVAELRVQRGTPAPAAGTHPAPPPPPGSGGPIPPNASVQFQGKNLTQDPTQLLNVLEDIAAHEGIDGADKFVDRFSTQADIDRSTGTGGIAGGSPDLNSKILQLLAQQRNNLHSKADKLKQEFHDKGEAVVKEMLATSEKTLDEEEKKYGIKTIPGTQPRMSDYTPAPGMPAGIPTTYQMENNQASGDLIKAAKQLAPLRRELDKLYDERDKLVKPLPMGDSPGPAIGVTPTYIEDQAKYDQLTSQIATNEPGFDDSAKAQVGKFPILAAFVTRGGATQLESIAAGPESAGNTVGAVIAEKRAKIGEVKDALKNHDVDIWSLPTIVAGTKARFGFGPDTLGNRIIDDEVHAKAVKKAIVSVALGVLGLALGFIAAIPTAGASFGVAAAVGGAQAGAAVLSTVMAAQALKDYQLAQAMSGTDVDKAKAISQEDPSLFWLAVDIVAAILDVKAALTAFRRVATVTRAWLSARAEAKEAKEIEAALKAACDDAHLPGEFEKINQRLGKLEETAKPVLDKLEETARAQYRALDESEKARLAGEGINSEEAFVKRMVTQGKMDILVSGEKGLKRTELVGKLLEPGNPAIEAIRKGDNAAMDQLLKEHGSWQQLMRQLDAGTPVTREAAQKMLGRRAEIEKEIEKFFGGKALENASKDPVSDVDINVPGKARDPNAPKGSADAMGSDAGKILIEAEQFVSEKYGKGWSDALRMNFYTQAERLTMYEKIMPGLKGADRAKLLGQMSEETNLYTIAKMLEEAHGDAAQIENVKALAKQLKVDINNPKITSLLATAGDEAAKIAERNKLIQKVDDLLARYKSLKPEQTAERAKLAQEITETQMRANFFTEEAHLGPGAVRQVAMGVNVVGQEAKQAATSMLAMVAHEVGKHNGDIAATMREYEIYKDFNRFATAARNAGCKHPGVPFWENMSAFMTKTDRAAASEVAHMGPRPKATAPTKTGAPFLPETDPTIGKVSDDYLRGLYNDFNAFSQEVLREMDMIIAENPGAWTEFNVPRPAAGTPAAR